MESIIVYKRKSAVDIIPENEFYENENPQISHDDEVIQEQQFNLFNLPYPILVKIVSYLSQNETFSLSNTCTDGWTLSKDQEMWKNKLWLRARVVSVSLDPPSRLPPRYASMIIRDPLLVDTRKLYLTLDPDTIDLECNQVNDLGNLLTKLSPSATQNIQDVFVSISNSVLGVRNEPKRPDVFMKGDGAPSFLLLGTPETAVSKKLALSFVTSKCSSVFETVGLVKGKPGGLGGGVTIDYSKGLMNILPIRKVRPRLLVNGQDGSIEFQKDVTELFSQIDGIIFYVDGSCQCSSTNEKFTQIKIGNHLHKYQKHLCNDHYIDLLELEVMLKMIPTNLSPPVLVLLAHPPEPNSDENQLNAMSDLENTKMDRHYPALIKSIFREYDIPWAVCDVEIETLSGIRKAMNWIIKRTLMIR